MSNFVFFVRLNIKFNKDYLNIKLSQYQNLFNNILGYSLDEEQRISIIKDEWYSLLLAGAGSGKTLTMIGKVLYLIKEGISPNEILVISFTNASVNSFIEKIKSYNLLKEGEKDAFNFK